MEIKSGMASKVADHSFEALETSSTACLNSVISRTIDIEALTKSLEIYHLDGTPRPAEEAPPLRALKGELIRNQEEIIRTPATGTC